MRIIKCTAARPNDGFKLAIGGFAVYNISIEHNDFYGSAAGIGTVYYDGRAGALRNISISKNYIHDLTLGRRVPAVEIGGTGRHGIVENATVTDNWICAAGAVTVQPGPGNAVSGTTGC